MLCVASVFIFQVTRVPSGITASVPLITSDFYSNTLESSTAFQIAIGNGYHFKFIIRRNSISLHVEQNISGFAILN
jgi:hypothetical protein